MKTLRDYQILQNHSVYQFLLSDAIRAQVYAPTGSGKTEMFMHTINDYVTMATRFSRNFSQLKILIAHPRIALSQDQMIRFKNSLPTEKYHYTSFHSGQHKKIADEGNTEGNTTNAQDVLLYGQQNSNRHQIVFSSYHSIDKLNQIEWDLIICDEAHNLANDGKFDGYAERLNGLKIIFYTATPVWSCLPGSEVLFDDNSMSNVSVYGMPIHQLQPKQLIGDGYVLAPMVHFQDFTTNQFGVDQDIDVVEAVATAYNYQHPLVVKNGMLYHQMLVASNGRMDINELNNRFHELKTMIGKDVTLITIMSDGQDEGSGVYINGRVYAGDRYQALQRLKTCGNSIIVHYDTLSEGIDISTLTGAFIMRALTKVKMIQTIGRVARPYFGDLDENGNPLFKKGLSSCNDVRKKRNSIVTFLIVNGYLTGGSGNIKTVQDIATAFASGGYEDLSTYVSGFEEGVAKGTHTNTDERRLVDQRISDILSCEHTLFLDAISKSDMYSDATVW